jgi:hypothetical protein
MNATPQAFTAYRARSIATVKSKAEVPAPDCPLKDRE